MVKLSNTAWHLLPQILHDNPTHHLSVVIFGGIWSFSCVVIDSSSSKACFTNCLTACQWECSILAWCFTRPCYESFYQCCCSLPPRFLRHDVFATPQCKHPFQILLTCSLSRQTVRPIFTSYATGFTYYSLTALGQSAEALMMLVHLVLLLLPNFRLCAISNTFPIVVLDTCSAKTKVK